MRVGGRVTHPCVASAFGGEVPTDTTTEGAAPLFRTRVGIPSGTSVRPVGARILDLHEWWAWVTIIANGLAGLWCLGAHWWAPLRVRALWWFVIAAEVAVFVQVALGVQLLAGQGLQVPQFHVFYGFVAIVAIAILYGYRSQLVAWQYLLYGFGGLFVMGLAIRAMTVNH